MHIKNSQSANQKVLQELWSPKFLELMLVCVFLSYIVSWFYCFTMRFSLLAKASLELAM